MSAFSDAYERQLRSLTNEFLAAIEGISDDDLNAWTPQMAIAGTQEITTFAALGVHIAGAGEFMTLIAVGGAPVTRDRDAEFVAKATRAQIEHRFDSWLPKVHLLLERLTEQELAAQNTHDRYLDRDWTNARILLHALDHTALHVGHAQIQRQLWEDEQTRGADRKTPDPVALPVGSQRITDKAEGRTNA